LADLPWGGWTVRLVLGVRRLFCDTPGCARRIFTERVPNLERLGPAVRAKQPEPNQAIMPRSSYCHHRVTEAK
jgi:hypothetical protein